MRSSLRWKSQNKSKPLILTIMSHEQEADLDGRERQPPILVNENIRHIDSTAARPQVALQTSYFPNSRNAICVDVRWLAYTYMSFALSRCMHGNWLSSSM